VFFILMSAQPVFPLIISMTENGNIYSSDIEPAQQNQIVYGINEKQGWTLEQDLTASAALPGNYDYYPETVVIPAGTVINSHLILHNPSADVDVVFTHVTFDSPIIGLMITGIEEDYNQLGYSDFLGVYSWPDIYDFENPGRRLELKESYDGINPWGNTIDPFSIVDPYTIDFRLPAKYPWSDQIRVITENEVIPNPEPGTLVLMGAGISCLAGVIKTRKKKSI